MFGIDPLGLAGDAAERIGTSMVDALKVVCVRCRYGELRVQVRLGPHAWPERR